jgi:1,4-alpha-glucan branching enzyme
MMSDDLLKERYASKLDHLIELAEREVDRTGRQDWAFHELAKMYRHRFCEIRDCWRRYDGDLVRGFRALQDAGRLEIITCTATHPFFPLLDRNWAAFRAQIHTAADLYERLFGRR